METQSVRIDKKLLGRVKRDIGKSKVPLSAWVNSAIDAQLKSNAISRRIMKSTPDPTNIHTPLITK